MELPTPVPGIEATVNQVQPPDLIELIDLSIDNPISSPISPPVVDTGLSLIFPRPARRIDDN